MISLAIFLSFFLQAFLYGEIIDQIMVLGQKSSEMQEHIDGDNVIIDYMNLEEDVTEQVRMF